MPGQGGSLKFDVTGLQVFEPAGAVEPTNIIPQGGNFDLVATFSGSGPLWANFKGNQVEYVVSYYLEGIGKNAQEVDLGTTPPKKLNPGVNVYTNDATRMTVNSNTLNPGIYRGGCIVTFPTWPGVTGFFENLLIEVYKP